MEGLDFIADKELRKTLEDSIEFVYTLHEGSKAADSNFLYQEETCRVIILYIISAIEAVLLYFFKLRNDKIEKKEYKCIQQMPAEYSHSEKIGSRVVVAIQEMVAKKEYEIGLHDLVTFYEERKMIRKDTAEKILELNDVRNTFHFSKARNKKCDLPRVEGALSLLLYVLEKAPGGLKKK